MNAMTDLALGAAVDPYTVTPTEGKAKSMLTKQRRYTPQEWKRFAPLFSSWTPHNLEAARLVLVEGMTAAKAGEECGITRQQAHLSALRVHEKVDKRSDEGRLPLTVWVKRSEYEATADRLRQDGAIIGGDDVVPDGKR